MPPFPPLEWDEFHWIGEVVLPAWAGFWSYNGKSAASDPDGSVELNVVTPDDEPTAPSSEQAAAYQHLVEQQEVTQDSILQAMFGEYPKWQKQFDYDDEEGQKLMPDVDRPDQLKSLISLLTVRIFSTSKSGLAYVGFQFCCAWDNEHALGAMVHANRVVEVGGADTAILEWIADKDVEAS